MKNIFKIPLLLFLILLLFPVKLTFAQNITVTLNGQTITHAHPAVLKDNCSYLPIDGYMQALGFEVTWDSQNNIITAQNDKTSFTAKVDDTNAVKNGVPITMNNPPIVVNGTVMLPLRFVAETAGATVGWHPDIQTVSITLPQWDIPFLTRSIVTVHTTHTQGSGIVLSADGLIATNFHVMNRTNKARITFSDGEVYEGPVFLAGYDVSNDIAILKIDKNNLYPVTIGRPSFELGVGSPVTAIGSPNGQVNTVSHGKITSIHSQMINSTAHIDVGSSGGALFDQYGRLIGMTSAFNNVGYFSIPAEKIASLPKNMKIPLEDLDELPRPLLPPKDITYVIRGDTTHVSWEPFYGIDYFCVYLSSNKDSGFTKIESPQTKSTQWYWDFPYCFSMTTSHNGSLYIKVSTMRNGEESALSPAIQLK